LSTVAYAQLTNSREAATPGTSTTTSAPGVKTYLDAFSALVPAEVLTLHALIISATTEAVGAPSENSTNGQGAVARASLETVSRIAPDAITTLQWSFWALIICSALLFAVPRLMGGKWDRLDFVRILIATLAFVGWTMLQRTTAFDAAFPGLEPAPRTVIALLLGAVLGAIAAALALQADKKGTQPK